MITRQITEAEHQAYQRVPCGCTCNDGKCTPEPCPFCLEVARIAYNRNELIQDR